MVTYIAPKEAIKTQINALEKSISETITSIRILEKEVRAIQQDCKQFQEVYHERVTPHYEALEALKAEINGFYLTPLYSSAAPASVSQSSSLVAIEKTNNELPSWQGSRSLRSVDKERLSQEEGKKIFRKLVKHYHPDKNPADPESKQAFELLMNSYERGDLSTLIHMEQITEEPSVPLKDNVVQLEILERKHDALQRQSDKLKREKYALEQSDTYKLFQRYRWSRINGDDLLENICQSIEDEIADNQSLLKRLKRRQQRKELMAKKRKAPSSSAVSAVKSSVKTDVSS